MTYIPPNANGQATSANSSPVVLASDQSAVPVSATSLPLPSGAATATKQDTGNTSVASIDTKTPALGQALAAASVPVVLPAAQITTLTPPAAITGFALDATLGTTNTEIGGLAETAPATDTASSGLNGRLQRISQRLTTLIGSTIAVSGTFWQATQPVSAASLPLPTGASTAAKQDTGNTSVASIDTKTPALGQALAAASVPVVLTAAQITTLTPSTTVTANLGTLNGAAQDGTDITTPTAMPAGGAGIRGWLSAIWTKLNGTIGVTGTFWQATQPVSGTFWQTTQPVSIASMPSTPVTGTFWQATQPVSGTVTTTPPSNASTNIAQINAVTPLMGNGVTGTGSQRVTIASDNTAFAVNAAATLAAETTKVIGTVNIASAQTVGTVTTVSTVTNLSQLGGTAVAMNTGVRAAGVQRVTIATDDVVPASQSGTWTVQPGNTANTTAWLTTSAPATTGGLSTFHLASAATTNLTNVKASAGQLYGYMVSNTSATYSYLCFHNASGTPTAGASIFFKIGIPAGGAANVEFSNGVAFSTGIAISTVTGAADNNTTAVALNDLIINLFYK